MGAWGIKALESDCGLDVVDYLEDCIADKQEEEIHLTMEEIINTLKGNLLGEEFNDIDFLYDNTAMAIAELFFDFMDHGQIPYDHEEMSKNLKVRVKHFTADKASLVYLQRCLNDIYDEVPDSDGEREIVEIWKDSNSFDEWRSHLEGLIYRIKKEIANAS